MWERGSGQPFSKALKTRKGDLRRERSQSYHRGKKLTQTGRNCRKREKGGDAPVLQENRPFIPGKKLGGGAARGIRSS